MIRTLTVFSVATVLLIVLSIPIMILLPGAFVLGGQHHIGPGETLEEDVSFYFAQVTIDEGALVDGNIHIYSSTLDLRGDLTGDLQAFESDLTLHESAHVAGEIDQNDLIHWTLLLPAIAQIPNIR
jgi:hypothetical protein